MIVLTPVLQLSVILFTRLLRKTWSDRHSYFYGGEAIMAARSDLIFPGEAPAQPSLENEPPRRIRTVVVDDSDTFLEVTCDLLDLEDVIDLVAAASDGVEAVTTVARLKPALVLMDVAMPGLDGLAATSLLRDMSPAPTVVLMSSEDTAQLRADCRRAGAFGFVNKLNFRDEFEAVLQHFLRRGEAQTTGEKA
jgi:CheY-like chemotaxis protein